MSLSSSGEPLTRRQLRELERAREAADAAVTTGQPLLQPAAAPDAPQTLTSPIAVVSPEIAATLPEHQLTRRELRALLQAQQGEAPEQTDPLAQASSSALGNIQPQPYGGSAVRAAPAHPDDAPRRTVAARPVVAESFRPVVPAAPPAPAALGAERQPAEEPRLFQPPTGHWSIGATGAVDQAQKKTDEGAHSRSVESSGASTSANALIIPSVPSIADITAPLTATGEILVTGSIDLPRALGATGQLPNRFDGADLDNLFDQPEAAALTDSAPVSATRAISTHVPTRNVIAPPKQQSTRVPTVLAITAGVIAVAVAGLFAAGFIFHLF